MPSCTATTSLESSDRKAIAMAMYFPSTTETVQQQDAVAMRQRQMQEQARADEEAYKKNVLRFCEMYLTLGPDVTKLATSTRFDGALREACGIAANKWSQLLEKEEQVIREEAALASRPKNRPAQQGDDLLPDRTLDARNAAWDDETRHRRESLAALKEQAERERKELEAFVTKRR
jgi:hypothetical protein